MSDAIAKLFEGGVDEPPLPYVAETDCLTGKATPCNLPIEALDDMDQPFRLYSEAEANAMRESIATHGVLQRILVRPFSEGRYQIISGRNRRNGARAAGLIDVPCEVRELSDDDAEALMIETNLNQRPKILPSERAWSYRRLLEIAKRQGQKIDFEEDGGSDCHKSRDALGAKDELKGRQVQNYISLTNLIPKLLAKVDEEKLAVAAGVQLSYLSTENQVVVYNYFLAERTAPISESLAAGIRAAGEKKALCQEDLVKLVAGPPKPSKVNSIPFKGLKKFFPREVTKKEVQSTTAAALKYYFESGKGVVSD